MIDADVEEIKPKDPVKAGKFMDYYWSGNKEHPNEMVELASLKHDPREYDMIFIGTPVWAWAPAPPIYTYLRKFDIKGKKIALFTTSEGERGKTFQRLRKLLEGNEIVSAEEFINPRNELKNECILKAREWAGKVLKKAK
jgi:hypothetical protein